MVVYEYVGSDQVKRVIKGATVGGFADIEIGDQFVYLNEYEELVAQNKELRRRVAELEGGHD